MQAASLKWLEMQRAAAAQSVNLVHAREINLLSENERLREENERLRRRCADLAASAELWIRLYEAALGRARHRDELVGLNPGGGWQHDRMDPMEPTGERVNVRPSRDVRLVEQAGRIVAYPEPHRTPVLPPGWAPLSREQQDAVLEACDTAPECLQFRVGSPWDPRSEYRVYQLQTDLWGGLAVALRCSSDTQAENRRQLLGLSRETARAVSIVVDFLNWDLEAHGQPWRLAVATAVEHS